MAVRPAWAIRTGFFSIYQGRFCMFPIRSALIVIALAAASLAQTSGQGERADAAEVRTQMRNVFYHYTERIAVHISWLEGAVIPTHEGSIVVFDDPKSFFIAIQSAKIEIGASALSQTMNDHVFTAKDAPLKKIEVRTEGQKLKVTGKLHSKGDVPFETESTIATTADGKIRMHAEKVKAAHLPVKGMMDLLGLDIAKLIDTRKVQGVRTEGDDLILDPQEILPLPRIQGKVSAVQIAGDQLVLAFGAKPEATIRTGNFMAYRGGRLRFGKLTMDNSDMDLIDMAPADPFDFYLDHYREQLSAGYTKITPQFGLRVYMRDYNKLRAESTGAKAPSSRTITRP